MSHPCIKGSMLANSEGIALDENEPLPMLAKRLESLSCSCRKKGEYNTFNSSELLSVTSSISWHHDTEKQYHLSNNPHPIHKILKYTMLFFISHTVTSLKAPRDVQQCTAFYSALEKPVWFAVQTPHPPLGLRYVATIQTARQQAGMLPRPCWALSHFSHLSSMTGRLPTYRHLSSCSNWWQVRQSKA